MKRSVKRAYILLVTVILLFTFVLPVHAKSCYIHDPMDNPKVTADIIVDSNAVYGYAPNPDSTRLSVFAQYDWSDEAFVADMQQQREEYHKSFQELYQIKADMEAEGKSVEEIARAVSTRRNEIRIEFYKNDPEGLEKLKQSNLATFGNENGGTPDYFYEKYGSWETVIEKAFSTNAGADAILGLYDKYYDTYVIDENESSTGNVLIPGDANLNGDVEITDTTRIQRYDAKMIELNDKAIRCADVDKDEVVCVVDATWIQRYLAGMNSPLNKEDIDDNKLYAKAVQDAMIANEDEIMPLVNITKDDENVIWNGDKVLVLFMHKYPDSYPAGKDIELQWGNVWCVSAGEFYEWVKNNGDSVTDWTKRLHQVLGMPTSKEYTTITAIWVDANLLYRPAFVSDPTAKMKTILQPTGDEAFDTMFKKWFDGNIKSSYHDGAYPWTRLGYTYDWADNGTVYGLSEFIIFSGAPATVEYTCTTDEFVTFAKAQ